MLHGPMAERAANHADTPHATSAERSELEASFERGDFSAIRQQLERLPQEDDEWAARLRAAISVDPAHAVVLAVCLVALLVIALRYLS